MGRGKINQIALSRDGTTLAVASDDGIALYDFGTWTERWSTATAYPAMRIGFSSDGALLNVLFAQFHDRGRGDLFINAIGVLRVHDGNSIRWIAPYDYWIPDPSCLAFSPDGTTLGYITGALYVWDLATGESQLAHHEVRGIPTDMAWSPNNTNIFFLNTLDNPVQIDVQDSTSGEIVRTFQIPTMEKDFPVEIALSPDGERLAVMSDLGLRTEKIYLLDARDGRLTGKIDVKENKCTFLQYSPDGGRLACGNRNGEVYLWNANTGLAVGKRAGDGQPINSILFSTDGQRLIIGMPGSIGVWEPATDDYAAYLGKIYSAWKDAVFSDAGDAIGLKKSGFVQWYSLPGQSIVKTIPIPDAAILSADFQRYSIIVDGQVELHSMANPTKKVVLAGPAGQVHLESFVFSPDNVTGVFIGMKPGEDGIYTKMNSTAFFWDIPQDEQFLEKKFDVMGSTNPTYVTYSPNGRYAVLWSSDWEYGNEEHIYEVQTGRHLGEEIDLANGERHGDCSFGLLAFTNNGDEFVSRCEDGICLYTTEGLAMLLLLEAREKGAVYTSAAFTKNGTRFLAGGQNGSIGVWDTKDGRLLRTLVGHQGEVVKIIVAKDDERFATLGVDGSVIVWNPANLQE